MKHVFAAQTFLSLIFHSSFLSQCILFGAAVVLFLILFFFFYKYFLLREYRAHIARAEFLVGRCKTVTDLATTAKSLAGTYPGRILGAGLAALQNSVAEHPGETVVKQEDAEAFIHSASLAFNRAVQEQYSLLPFLSVSAAVSPLVGLFGTITGLIQSFMAIGRVGNADLASIAPGIAEALLTTFGGLVVAIPAFVLFHLLTSYIQSFEFELEQLTSSFETIVSKQV